MTIMEGVATSQAPPEKVWAVLTDAKRLPEWFFGVKDVETADGWPAVGGRVSFRVGSSRFAGKIVEARPPNLIVMQVGTPSGHSRVTSRIEPEGTGSRYTRTVDATWKNRFVGPVFGALFIRGAVKREAKKLCAIAER